MPRCRLLSLVRSFGRSRWCIRCEEDPHFLRSGRGRLTGVTGTHVDAVDGFARQGFREGVDGTGLAEDDFLGEVDAVTGREEFAGCRG